MILKRQMGKNLGRRMYHAFNFSYREGFEQTIIIGTDCMSLQTGDINRAFQLMGSKDGVLGPTHDGGYYLIGMKHPRKSLFSQIEWSTPRVFATTMQKISKSKLRFGLLKKQEDIDEYITLRKFAKKLEKTKKVSYTRDILKTMPPTNL